MGKFQKGKAGGPGRPKGGKYAQIARELTNTTFRIIASKYVLMPYRQMLKIQEEEMLRLKSDAPIDEKDPTALEMAVLMTMAKTIQTGEIDRLETLFNRLMGKPPQEIRLAGSEEDSNPVRVEVMTLAEKVVGMNEEQLEKTYGELLERLEKIKTR